MEIKIWGRRYGKIIGKFNKKYGKEKTSEKWEVKRGRDAGWGDISSTYQILEIRKADPCFVKREGMLRTESRWYLGKGNSECSTENKVLQVCSITWNCFHVF